MSMPLDERWYPTPTDPEWSDLTPIPLTEEDQRFVSIPGTQQYQAIMSYLRALLAAQEYSARGLKLTDVAIQCLPSNYTIWHYRRLCLDAVGGDWDEELSEMIELSKDNPKTYQVWQFRKTCTSKLDHPRGELFATEEYILDDQKNYHVWGYRQWLLRNFPAILSHQLSQKPSPSPSGAKFSAVDEELLTYLATTPYQDTDPTRLSNLTLEQFSTIPLSMLPIWAHEFRFCDQLLFTDPEADLRNNSAWNQRMFVMGFAFGLSAPHPAQFPQHVAASLPHDTIEQLFATSFFTIWANEIKTVIDSFTRVAKNESAYNYLHGLCALQYKTSPDPALPTTLATITPDNPIVSSCLGLLYPVVVALYKFTMAKQVDTVEATDPTVITVPELNRFFLSFLVDFLLILIKMQPVALFGDTLELFDFKANHRLPSSGTVRPVTEFIRPIGAVGSANHIMSASQLKELTSKFVTDVTTLPPSTFIQAQSLSQPLPGDDVGNKDAIKVLLQQAVQTTAALTEADPLRAKYWTFRNIQIHKRYQADLV